MTRTARGAPRRIERREAATVANGIGASAGRKTRTGASRSPPPNAAVGTSAVVGHHPGARPTCRPGDDRAAEGGGLRGRFAGSVGRKHAGGRVAVGAVECRGGKASHALGRRPRAHPTRRGDDRASGRADHRRENAVGRVALAAGEDRGGRCSCAAPRARRGLNVHGAFTDGNAELGEAAWAAAPRAPHVAPGDDRVARVGHRRRARYLFRQPGARARARRGRRRRSPRRESVARREPPFRRAPRGVPGGAIRGGKRRTPRGAVRARTPRGDHRRNTEWREVATVAHAAACVGRENVRGRVAVAGGGEFRVGNASHAVSRLLGARPTWRPARIVASNWRPAVAKTGRADPMFKKVQEFQVGRDGSSSPLG